MINYYLTEITQTEEVTCETCETIYNSSIGSGVIAGIVAGLISGIILLCVTKYLEYKQKKKNDEINDKKMIVELAKNNSIDDIFLYIHNETGKERKIQNKIRKKLNKYINKIIEKKQNKIRKILNEYTNKLIGKKRNYTRENLNKYLRNKSKRFIEQNTHDHIEYKVIGDMISYKGKVYFPSGYTYGNSSVKNYVVAPLYDVLNEQYKIMEDVKLLSEICVSKKYTKYFDGIIEKNKVTKGVYEEKGDFIPLKGKCSEKTKYNLHIREPFKPYPLKYQGKLKLNKYKGEDDNLNEILYNEYHKNNRNPKKYTEEEFKEFIEGKINTEIVYIEGSECISTRFNCYNYYEEIRNMFNKKPDEESKEKETKKK